MKPSIRQKPNIGYVVIPYTQGIAESVKNICGKYGIQAYFKVTTTIKQLLMTPKEPDHKDKKSRVIYSYQCGDIACSEEYIGETARTLGETYKEHLKQSSPIQANIQQTGHYNKQQLQHHWEGGPGAGQDHKRICLDKGEQSNAKQEHW